MQIVIPPDAVVTFSESPEIRDVVQISLPSGETVLLMAEPLRVFGAAMGVAMEEIKYRIEQALQVTFTMSPEDAKRFYEAMVQIQKDAARAAAYADDLEEAKAFRLVRPTWPKSLLAWVRFDPSMNTRRPRQPQSAYG